MNRKEIKQQYKQETRACGVFQIRNTANGKVLLGSSMNLEGSRNRFAFEQKMGSVSKNRVLLEDWKEHGGNAFVFEVLEELDTDGTEEADRRADLAALEELWIEKLQPFGEKGYNARKKE